MTDTTTFGALTSRRGRLAVGEVEISRPLEVRSPLSGRAIDEHDSGLVVVRLDGIPLGTIVAERSVLRDPRLLAACIWDHLADRILEQAAVLVGERPEGLGPEGLALVRRCRATTTTLLPTASVVVATRDRPRRLASCLDALLALDHQPLEIIVVDNDPSTEATRALVAERYAGVPGVRYVREPTRGISPARNRGLMEAKGEVVVFTDDDVVVDHQWLGALLAAFEPGVGCVSGLLMPAELESEAQLWFEQYGGFGKGFVRRVFDHRRPPGVSPLYPYVSAAWGTGGAIAVEARLLRQLGGFDVALGSRFVGSEDLDAFTRIILAGHAVVYEPAALGWHVHRSSLEQLRQQVRGYGVGLGALATKWVVQDRRAAWTILSRAPAALCFLLRPSSPKNRRKRLGTYPPMLTRAELRGAMSGPAAYVRARRAAARGSALDPITSGRQPLLRNAYALIANTVGTSVLGVLYWVLAARFYSPDAVGNGSAMISVMLMLSGISQLNLMGALSRFLPIAGDRARHLVVGSYGACVTAAIVVAGGFVVAAHSFAARHSFLDLGVLGSVWLVLAVAAWSLFTLQDSVLAGLRQAVWVPVENIAFGVLKIVALLAFAPLSQHAGVFASFTIPTAISLVPVNWLVFRRLLPRRPPVAPDAIPLQSRSIVRFAAGDFLGSLFSYANLALLPLVVIAKLGARANAHFYVAWVVKISFDALAQSVATSLTVEGAHDESRVGEYVHVLLRRAAVVVVPAAFGLITIAPAVLRILGPTYAQEATGVLRLLTLSAIPGTITFLYAGVHRVTRRIGRILAIRAVECLGVLALSVLLMPRLGLAGVGLATLLTRTAVAVAILPSLLRLARRRAARLSA